MPEVTRGKLATKVYWGLKRKIATSELLPGTALQELALCEQWGVSRTPVREALKMLSAEGLVEPRRGSGYSVAQVSRQDVIEAYQVRIWLEPPVAASAARLADDVVIAQLRQTIERMAVNPLPAASDGKSDEIDLELQYEFLYSDKRRQTLTDLDAEFHNVILAACGNSLARTFLQQARMVTQRASYLIPPGRLQHTYDEHLAIFTAIAERDDRAAESSMREHLNSTFRRLYSAGWAEVDGRPEGDELKEGDDR